MIRPSAARIAAHDEASALVAAFRALSAPEVASEPAAVAADPSLITCDGTLGWASRYLCALSSSLVSYVSQLTQGLTQMITFHPAARKIAHGSGFIPMVTLRNAKGQMVGSKVPHTGFTFASAAAAKAHALTCALRVAMAHPEFMTVCKA